MLSINKNVCVVLLSGDRAFSNLSSTVCRHGKLVIADGETSTTRQLTPAGKKQMTNNLNSHIFHFPFIQ